MRLFEVGILSHSGLPLARRVFEDVFTYDPMYFSGILMTIQYIMKESYQEIAEQLALKKHVIHCKLVQDNTSNCFLIMYAVTSRRSKRKTITKIFDDILKHIDLDSTFENPVINNQTFDYLSMVIDHVIQERLSWKDVLSSLSE